MNQSKSQDVVIGGEKTPIPFEVVLNKKSARIRCNEILRFVPGRRAVFSGSWNEKKIVAKFYFKPVRYKKHVKRELEGNGLLEMARVPTASIIHSEFCTGMKAHLLIFEFIQASLSLEKIFKSDSHGASDKKHLLSLIRIIARLHEKGIIHNDLHPDNFLVKDDIIYALDGAAVEQKSNTPLKTNVSLENLSILLSQVDLSKNDLFYDLVGVYTNIRNFKNVDGIEDKLKKYIAISRKRLTGRYLEKIYRNSTKILCKKSFSSLILCRREYLTPAMICFLNNPDVAFENPDQSLLKAGNSATVIRHNIDGIELVIKRYNMKNIIHAVRRAFKKTRADISWRSAHLLMKNRINTSRPVAMIEKRFGPFRNKAFFICEYIRGEDARHYFPNSGTEDASYMGQSIIRLFTRLKSLMISHGDMKATNIIIRDEEPFLIDLDSMTLHKRKARFLRAHKKDVNRFLKNWRNYPEISNVFKKLHP